MAGGGRTETAAQRRKPRAKFFGGDVATLTLPGSVTVGENQALELTYRYVVGYGCDGTPDGPTFQVHVENLLPSFGHNVGAEQGPFTDFPYDDTYDGSDCAGCPTCYSPVQTPTPSVESQGNSFSSWRGSSTSIQSAPLLRCVATLSRNDAAPWSDASVRYPASRN